MMLRRQTGHGTIAAVDFGDVLTEMVSVLEAGPYDEPLAECAEKAREQLQDQFNQEQTPEGTPWEPWHFSPEKDAASLGKQTLQHTGMLMASYTQKGATGNVTRIDSHSLEVGSNLSYAATHEFGATITTGIGLWARGGDFYLRAGSQINIPERPVAGWRDETLGECEEIVATFVMDEVLI